MESQAQADETKVLFGKEQILTRLLRHIWNGLLIIALVGGVASIQRFRYTGWLPIYSLHLFLMISFTAAWILRNRFSFNARVAIMLLLFYIVGITGLFSFGLIGAGIWWLILCALMANVFYSRRTGIIHGVICLGIIIAAGFAVTQGLVTLPFDANEYITRPSTWFTLMIGCVALSLFIFTALTAYQREILKLLSVVEKSRKQKDELIRKQKQALDEIKTLQSIIPICANCKKVRDDDGYWENVEGYMQKHADMKFSHCLCPTCGETLYGGVWNEAYENMGVDGADDESMQNSHRHD